MHLNRILLSFLLGLLVLAKAGAQIIPNKADSSRPVRAERQEVKSPGPIEKLVNFLTIEPNEARAARDSTIYPSKIVFSPYVIYTPETNIGIGVGGSYVFKLPNSGGPERTRTSIIPIAFTYTLENQVLAYSGFEIFWPDEKYVLSGNVRAQIFPQLYFGIGPETPESNEVIFESTQVVLEPIFSKQMLIDKLFLGAGFRYRYVTGTDFVKENGEGPLPIDFSQISGSDGSTSVGIEAAALYDTRNSLLNAQRGTYLEATHGAYDKVLGGTHRFQLTRTDLRHFIQLRGQEDWRDVLGFHALGYFSWGDVPLVEHAQLGSGEMMRGYYEGRYSDRHYLAAQTEYRLNMKRGPFGMVGFASLGNVAPEISDFRLSTLRGAAGMGLRLMIDKVERLNLRADIALTTEGDLNYYLMIGEAF